MDEINQKGMVKEKSSMEIDKISVPYVFFTNNCMAGEEIVKSTRLLGDLEGVITVSLSIRLKASLS